MNKPYSFRARALNVLVLASLLFQSFPPVLPAAAAEPARLPPQGEAVAPAETHAHQPSIIARPEPRMGKRPAQAEGLLPQGSGNQVIIGTNDKGIFVTADINASPPVWSALNGGLTGDALKVNELALDPFNIASVAYAAAELGVYRNTTWQASGSWTEILNRATAESMFTLDPGTARFADVKLSPVQRNMVFVVVTGVRGGADRSFIARSEDGGSTWAAGAEIKGFGINPQTRIYRKSFDGSTKGSIWVSSHDPNKLWAAAQPAAGSGNYLSVSTDKGNSFTALRQGGNSNAPTQIYVPRRNNPSDQIMYLFGFVAPDLRIEKSTDGGLTWVNITPAGRVASLHSARRSFDAHTSTSGVLFAATSPGGNPEEKPRVSSSSDDGQTWSTGPFLAPHNYLLMDLSGLPNDSQRLLAALGDAGFGTGVRPTVMSSQDRGATWIDKTGNLWDLWGDSGSCCNLRRAVTAIQHDALAPPTVPDEATHSSGHLESGTQDVRECSVATYNGTQGIRGHPINTRTGGLEYSLSDLSIPTSAAPLVFQRSYSSLATNLYTTILGFGWTHNHETRLIFPGDPGGRPGVVLFKAESANQYEFIDNEDGTFTPSPGVCGSLTRNAGPPVTYAIVDKAQRRYTFDQNGKLLTWADPQGHTFSYTYDANGRLSQVGADGGQRFLSLSYDAQGRITSVADHTGRAVSFAYDAAGDLTSFVDVLGQTWTYAYDAGHRLTQVIDPRAVATLRTEYDAQGRAVRQFDGLNNKIVEITYNPDGTATVVDARGNAEIHTYDGRNTLTGETDALGGATSKTYDGSFRPASITDPVSDTTTLTWSANGANLTRVVDAAANRTDLTYDSLNNLTSVIDPRGFLTTYTYSGTLLASSTDALNNITTYTYTDAADAPAPPGLLESVTDPLGRTTSYAYNAFGQRTSITDALGNITTYTYDNLGRLIETRDPLGRVTRNEYDAADRLIRVTRNYDPARPQNDQNQYNLITTYQYDAVGNLLTVTDTLGRITRYEYDNANRLIRTTDPAGNITTNAYDAAGNLTSTTDPLGRITTYTYDSLNRLTSTRDPLGNTTTTTYNSDSTVASTTDALGNTTSFTYDDLKRVITVIDPLGKVTQYAYDAVGNRVSGTDANGTVTRFEYDALNRLTAVVENYRAGVTPDAQTNVRTEYTYDAVGNRLTIRDAKGNVTSFAYDALNRLTSETDPLGNVTRYAYDAVGNRTRITDATGAITNFVYDAVNRLTTIDHPAPDADVTFSYDAVGNRLGMNDGVGATNWTYDILNRVTAVTDPFGDIVRYAYDAVSNRTSLTYPDGKVAAYAYDAADRLTQVTDWVTQLTSYTYDAANRLTTVSLPNGVTSTYTYDTASRLLELKHVKGVQTLSSFQYTYDAAGNRSSLTETVQQPPEWIFADSFESGNLSAWSSSVTDGGDLSVTAAAAILGTYGMQALLDDNNAIYVTDQTPQAEPRYRARFYFDPNSIPMADGNAHYIFYGYQGSSTLVLRVEFRFSAGSYQLRAELRKDGNQWTSSAWFTISDASHFVELDWRAATAAGANNGGLTLWIDGIQKANLTSVDNDTRRIDLVWLGAVAGVDRGTRGTYYFDAFESRRQTYIGPNPTSITTTITYTYDPLYRLTAANYSTGAFFRYTYDAAGNRVSQQTLAGTNTYLYDAANRLTSVDGVTYTWDAKGNLLSDGVSTYTYDHANRLKSVVQGANTYSFAYNGLGDRLQQTVNGVTTRYTLDLNAGLTQVLADESKVYLYGLGRIGEQQPGGWAYHLSEALGSVRQVTDLVGAVTRARSYEPFGSTLTSAGTVSTAYGFTGEWTDQTGLIHLRARYYGPQWGRFFVKDPWKGSVRQPATRNAYTYVLNNPTLYTDPSGQRVAVDLGLYSRPGLTLALQITGVLSALRCGQTNAAQASMAISTRSVLSRPTQPIPQQTGNGTFLELSSAQWDEIAHGASAIAAVIDVWMASFTVGTSIGGCIGGAVAGGRVLEGCVIGYGLGTTMTFIPRNIANVISSVGAYAAVRSDLASGETQIGNGNHPIVIGEDSKVAVAAALLGWVDQDPFTSALLASYVVTQDQGWLPCLALCGPTTINR